MDKFQNKYLISSARLQSWDYRWEGIYFITICTQDKEHYFGEINDDKKMQLSNIGIIADILWHEIPNHSQNVELGAYVIMPNHIHGILILTGNNGNDNVHARHDTVETGHAVKETGHALSDLITNLCLPFRAHSSWFTITPCLLLGLNYASLFRLELSMLVRVFNS